MSNWDGGLAKPTKGMGLTVSLGYAETGLVPMGRFTVETVTKRGHLAAFEVTAHAADFKKQLKAKRTRVFKATTFGAMMSTIAADAALTAACDPSLAKIPIDHEAQTEESDMHLLMRLGRRFGAVCKPGNGKLLAVPRSGGTDGAGAALAAVTINPNDLLDGWEIGDHDRPKHGKCTANYYDHGKAQRVPKTAGTEGDPEYVIHELYPSEDHAQRAANSRSKHLKRHEKQFSGRMFGQPWLHAGTLIQSSGFGDDDDMAWTVKTARHKFGADGIVTGFEGEPKRDLTLPPFGMSAKSGPNGYSACQSAMGISK